MGFLRLSLAAIVLLGHLGRPFFFATGGIAVCCFYIISGFYIQLLLSQPDLKVRNFYLSRAFRIYPLYWLFFVIRSPFLKSLFALLHAGQFKLTLIYAFNNLFLFGQDVLRLTQYNQQSGDIAPILYSAQLKEGYVLGQHLTIFGQSWTLAIELMFYLIAPLLLSLSTRTLSLLLCIFILTKAYLIEAGLFASPWFSNFFPIELGFFIAGALGYRAYSAMQQRGWHKHHAYQAAACIFLIVILASLTSSLEQSTIYVIATCATAAGVPFLFGACRYNLFDRRLGDLSYPIYISHMTVFMFLRHQFEPLDIKYGGAIYISGVLLASIVAYLLIERPVDRWRHQRFPTHTQIAS